MATSDIMKQAVFDQRIVQMPPRYAVQKGALSVTNAPYSAIAATTSQHTYNINVPSQNVFVDRAVDWQSFFKLKLSIVLPAAAAANQILLQPGRDFAVSAFPLHELTQTMTATINDTSVIINTDTVLHEVLRLTDYKKNRIPRHCPTMLDRYAVYSQGGAVVGGVWSPAVNNPLNGYFSATDDGEVPNGAWYGVEFTDANGAVITAATANSYTSNGNNVGFVAAGAGFLPYAATVATLPATSWDLYIRVWSSEKLVLSPFVFADSCEWETGLFGINNIQLVMNLKSDPSRVIRWNNATLTSCAVSYQNLQAVFDRSQVMVQYLTPSLDLPLPSKSVVPYMEFPRYITTSSALTATGQFAIQSQTIVLPQIPDYLIIYVKPTAAQTGAYGDWYYPITNISVNFDNFAGLLSAHTPQQLYQMSVHNGLEMDWNQWYGQAWAGPAAGLASGTAAALAGASQNVQTTGGFLVLKPGQDFGLQSGQAPSLIGNFTLQFNIQCQNYFAQGNLTPQLTVIAVNSGFFETLAGSSRIIKGVLSEADIISAEPVMEMTREGLNRIVGGGFFDKLGSMLTKAVDIYTKSKPIISGVKGLLPDEGFLGKVKSGMSKVGYGVAGAGVAGAGVAGAAMTGAAKKSLSARLM